MDKIKITNDENEVHVKCPHCDNGESHPIDEQRHHLQSFDIVEWLKDKEIETSLMKCHACNKEFELEWDYNATSGKQQN